MQNEKTTESEEILEFRFSNVERAETDYTYNEAVMSELISDFLKKDDNRPQ